MKSEKRDSVSALFSLFISRGDLWRVRRAMSWRLI
jgi:hypothetical protein